MPLNNNMLRQTHNAWRQNCMVHRDHKFLRNTLVSLEDLHTETTEQGKNHKLLKTIEVPSLRTFQIMRRRC